MKNYFAITLAAITILISCGSAPKQGHRFPPPTSFVNDYENILTQAEEDTLNQMIKAHKQLTTDQIAIVTIKDYPAPYADINRYSLDLANDWGIGTKAKSNGVLIAISVNNRAVRIQTGTGTELRINDYVVKQIIDKYMMPNFKNGLYYQGIKQGTIAMIDSLQYYTEPVND